VRKRVTIIIEDAGDGKGCHWDIQPSWENMEKREKAGEANLAERNALWLLRPLRAEMEKQKTMTLHIPEPALMKMLRQKGVH
jgi:hypothetical protein